MPRKLFVSSVGDDVKFLQETLNAEKPGGLQYPHHPAVLAVDGKFGPVTRSRVIDFQTHHELVADGIVGPLTWGKLLHHSVKDTLGFCVLGRHLYDSGGSKTILRGINLPVLDDWNFPPNPTLDGYDVPSYLADTGANAVRIQWYMNYDAGRDDHRDPSYDISHLDALLEKCREKKLVPIVGLWDGTSKCTIERLNAEFVPWWESMLPVLNKHKKYLILNLANELGCYFWKSEEEQAAALTQFRTCYEQALSLMRAQWDGPIMIDATDGGTAIGLWNDIGPDMRNSDPDYNIVFDVHAYWADADLWGENRWQPLLLSAVSSNLPIVFGEIANKQDKDEASFYDLDLSGENDPAPSGFLYPDLLKILQEQDVGWLAWSWGPDNCAQRRLSSDGTDTALTNFGNDIVNNAFYGLKATAVKSEHFG
jgi:mannan endo-1,4-beta-mannosidase